MYIFVYYLVMTFNELENRIKTPVFSNFDVEKMFPQEEKLSINTQLNRFVKSGELLGLKKGLYCFSGQKVATQVLANAIYEPSYVSLEYVLNNSGVIPDIAMNVTSVTTTKNKIFTTPAGVFLYHRVQPQLFFGFQSVKDGKSGFYYKQAYPEKALLDYIYIRKIKSLEENRVESNELNRDLLLDYALRYPNWVRKVIKSV